MANLEINICGMKMKNPIMTAAGPGAKDYNLCAQATAGGAGALVTKTISDHPASVPRPCMGVTTSGFLNSELWSEHTAEHWVENEYPEIRKLGLPVIAGIGYSKEQIEKVAPMIKPYCDAVEMSVHYVGTSVQPMLDALAAAKKALDVPVFMKMSPHTDIAAIAKACEKAGVDGLVLINSVGPCMAIDLNTGLPTMGSSTGYGWLTGTAIRPIAVRVVYDIRREVKIPIIGVGGVSTGRDAAEFLMAGASAVQVCTESILKGPTVYGRIAGELNKFLDSKGYKSVDEIVGLTHTKMADRVTRTHSIPPVIDNSKCRRCGACLRSCVYDAISIQEDTTIDPAKCFGCGLCVTRCKASAMSMSAT